LGFLSLCNVVVLLTVSRWPIGELLVVTSPAEAEPRWPPAVGLLPVNGASGGRYFERAAGSGRPFTFFLLLIYFQRIKLVAAADVVNNRSAGCRRTKKKLNF
jgi:hypothetical protein